MSIILNSKNFLLFLSLVTVVLSNGKIDIIYMKYRIKLHFEFLLIVLKESKDTGCYCHFGSGNYCGTRKIIGHLRGNCVDRVLYYCPGANGLPASSKGTCPGFCIEGDLGLDYCPIRKHTKSKLNLSNIRFL